MIVHMMAVPPTHDAMTISTVNVVRVILEDEPEGMAEVLGVAFDACVVIVTCALVGAATTRGVVATIDGGDMVDEGEFDDNDEDVLEEELELELELELKLVCVSGLRMLLRPKGSLVEDDDEEIRGVLEEAGVFSEGTGVLDGLGVDVAVGLVADGASVLAPLTDPALPPKMRVTSPCGEGARFLIRRLRLA